MSNDKSSTSMSFRPFLFIVFVVVAVIIMYSYVSDKMRPLSDKPVKIINLPIGEKLSSVELLDGSYTTAKQADTIKIYDSRLEYYQDAAPTVNKKLIYVFIQH